MSPIAELPVIGRSFGEVYNRPGSFSCTIPMDLDPRLGVTRENLGPPDGVWAAELDGHLLWAGPVLALKPDFENDTVTLAGEGWLNLLRRRFQSWDVSYNLVDQCSIARGLINNVQDPAFFHGHVGVDTTIVNPASFARVREYFGAELGRTGELIENLAAVDGGFYFRFEPRWSNGPNSLLTIKFLCQVPQGGRATDIVLDDGNNCTVVDATDDGTRLANRVIAVGQGEGDNRPRVIVDNPSHIAAHYILEDDVQHGTVTDPNVLRGHARDRLREGADRAFIPTVRVPVSMIGEFLVGDRVRFKMARGLYTIDATYRIVSYSCPDEDWVDLDLSPLVLMEGGSFSS